MRQAASKVTRVFSYIALLIAVSWSSWANLCNPVSTCPNEACGMAGIGGAISWLLVTIAGLFIAGVLNAISFALYPMPASTLRRLEAGLFAMPWLLALAFFLIFIGH